MMRSCVRLSLLNIVIALVLVPSLGAQEAITVSGGPYELAEADGTHTLTVTVTNATERPVDLMLAPETADEGCTITADPDEVNAQRSEEVEFTLPAACELGERSTDLRLTVMPGAGSDDLVFPIAAETPEDTPSDPGPFWGYGWAAGAVAVGLLILYVYLQWQIRARGPKLPPLPGPGTGDPARRP